MVNTAEEIMLTLEGRDNASQMFANVDKNAQSMASNISAAMSQVNMGLMNIGQVSDNVMQSLTGKSALDNIFGTTSKAETNSVLLKNMLDDAGKNYDKFYEKVDKTTDSSLTSMQELIPALKAFKSATGATDKEMTNITDEMANFGAAVLAQTGSTDLAQQSMMDLSKGIKGAFASLDQYGITQDALQRTGYWNGDEKDVEGFMRAVEKVTGSTEELMQTNTGLDALIGKAFSRAGKKIGNEFLPFIKDVKRGFIDLDNQLGGGLAASMLVVSGGIDVMNQGFWNISTAANGIRDLHDAFTTLKSAIKGAGEAAEATGDAINTISNISDMGAGAAGLGGAVGAGAEASKKASKGEKAVEGGMDALMVADMLKDNKSAQKDAKELLKELGQTENISKEVSKYSKQVYDPKKWASFENYEKIRDVGAFGETGGGLKSLISSTENSRKDAGNLLKELSSSKSEMDLLQNELDTLQTPKTSFQKIGDWFKGLFKGADEIGDVSKTVSGAEDIAEGVSGLGAAGSAVAAAGPEMEAAAAGGAAAEAGATGLAATFTGLIVPLLAISAVIIVMIPIVALIAAEAMVFIKLLADFMQSLNFDNINLDGAVKGISQVATALAWVGVAMAAMSFASIMTGLAVITGGFLGILGPLDVAVNALKQAGQKLAQFNTVAIDPSIGDKIRTISQTLGSVAEAMGSLTWNNIVTGFSNFVANLLGFSSVTDGLEQAKNDIIAASQKLNEFSSITPLDDSVAQNIQNVCNSLASIGDAMSALRSIRDSQNWDELIGNFISGIFGEGVDIQTALMNVKDDIIKASQALAQFEGISEIPEDISGKIQKVGSTLTTVNDTITTIKEMVGSGFDNWVEGLFGGYDVAGGLEQIKNDLITASQKLAELSALSEIDEGITEKITQVGTALQKVNEVSTTLTGLGDSGIGDFDPSIISTAVNNVKTAATELAKLNEVAFDGAAADTMLGAIQTTLENVKSTLSAATGFSDASVSIGSQIITGVQTGLAPLGGTIQTSVSSAINSAGGNALAGGSMLGRAATSGMKSSLQLKSTMEAEVSYTLQAITSKEQEFYNAGVKLGEAAKRGFESAKAINPGSPGNLAHTMMDEVGYILEAMKSNFSTAYSVAAGLGSSIFSGFGNPSLDMDMFTNGGQLTAEHIGALKTTISNAPDKTDNRPVTIIVQEGAVNVDARNYTTKEAQGLMITALEGMDHIDNIDVDGV